MVKKLKHTLPPKEEREEIIRCIQEFAEEKELSAESLRRQYHCATQLFTHCADEEWIEQLSDAVDADVSEWLLELPFSLRAAGLIDEAVEHGRRWAAFIERDNLLADRAVILAEAGREAETHEQILQLYVEFPEDVWVQIKIGDALLALGNEREAESRYRNAFTLSESEFDREGIMERFIPMLQKLGRTEEAEIFERHAEAAQPLCSAMRDELYLSAPDVQTVNALREFFEPYFLWSLARRAAIGTDDKSFSGYADVQAIFFLADWGIDRHIPDLLKCLSMSEVDLDVIYGEMLTEEMWAPFAKVGQNHIELMERFIHEPSHYVHARWAVYSGLVAIHHFHSDRRAEVVAAAERIFQIPKPFPDDILAALMCDCIESGLTELSATAAALADTMEPSEFHTFTADDVRDALDTGALPTFVTGRPTDALSINREWEKAEERLANEIEDEGWDPDESENGDFDDNELDPITHPTLLEKFIDPFAGKIGRNDPCPCGSGKKYKKCHGAA